LAAKEAGGNWANKSNPKYMGGLQFDQPTWDAYKPAGAPNNPADATKDQQIAAGQKALASGRTPESLWPTNYAQLNTPGTTGPAQSPGGPAPGLPGLPGIKSWFPPKAPAGPPPNRTSLPDVSAAGGIGPYSYSGIGATDNATTALAKFGGIPGAPSGQGEDVLNFMQGQMNAFNQRTGSHLSVTADYPGGPKGHPDDGADHSVRRAMDFGGSQKDMDAFAAYWANDPQLRAATRQLIHNPAGDNDPNNPFNANMNIIGGHLTSGWGTYGSGDQGMGGHGDHDHIALQYIPNVSAGPNVAPAAPSADTSGGPPNVHVTGDYNYMPMHVAPSAIDPGPAVTAFQNQQNAQMASAGGPGVLPA
jgi:hypothetical protein